MWGKRKTPSDPPLELVTVLASPDPGLIAVAKSILESAGIRFLAQGEVMRNIWGLEPVLLQVRREDVDDALALLAELKETGPEGERPS
jgi:Putative prokaryotic signal transducing protein